MKPSSPSSSTTSPSTAPSTAPKPAGRRSRTSAGSRASSGAGDEVVMVVDVRDPRTGDPVRASTAQGERVDAAVREAHAIVEAHGGRTVALLGTRLVGSFPDGAVEAGLDAAVDLQQRSALPASASWACSIGLATGPDNHQVDSASLGIPLVGGAVDRALLLAAWSSAGAVLADDRTIATAQRCRARPDPADAADATAPGQPGQPGEPEGAWARWSLGASHVLVGHEREPVEYWELSFVVDAPDGPVTARDAVEGAQAGQARVEDERVEGPRATGRPGVAAKDRPAGPEPTRTGVRARLDALDPTRPLAAAMAPPARRPDVRITTRPGSTKARAWSRGEVRCWFPNRGRGVIGSSTTQEFYVDRRFLAVPSTIGQGDTVYFVPRDAVGGGRNPAASAVLVVGAEVEVRVDRVDPRGFGVAELRDPAGTRASLVLDLAAVTSALSVEAGDWLLVRIRAAEHGPVGEPL